MNWSLSGLHEMKPVLNKVGKIKKEKGMKKNDRNKKIVELCKNHTHKEVAELFNLSTKTIQRCIRKNKSTPPKKIELDPMLEDFKPSTENLDHMILTRQIELNLLKRMRGD